MKRAVRVAALLVGIVSAGCSTVPPPGFAARGHLQHVELRAKPLEMYSDAPLTWLGPDGEVGVRIDESTVSRGLGGYSADLRYSVAFRDRGDVPLRCTFVAPADGLLSCAGSSHAVRLEAGPGCSYPDDLTTPSCGWAELVVGAARWQVREGSVSSLGVPSGELSIVDDRGRLVAAADIVAEMRMEAWLPPRTSARDRDIAVLVITAWHQWRHRAQPS